MSSKNLIKHSISIGVNVPMMLMKIGTEVDQMKRYYNASTNYGQQDLSEDEIQSLVNSLKDLKSKDSLIQAFLGQQKIHIADFKRSKGYDFYVQEFEDFCTNMEDILKGGVAV